MILERVVANSFLATESIFLHDEVHVRLFYWLMIRRSVSQFMHFDLISK